MQANIGIVDSDLFLFGYLTNRFIFDVHSLKNLRIISAQACGETGDTLAHRLVKLWLVIFKS